MIPTREVPQGLSADEYLRLSVQYLLLGWSRQMVTAAKKAAELHADLSKFAVHLSYENYDQLGFALGLVENTIVFGDQANEVFRAAIDGVKEVTQAADAALDGIEPVKEFKQEISDAFNFFRNEAQRAFDQAFEEFVAPALGLPGRDVPEHLMASEYIDLAQTYRLHGWPEQSRDAIEKAIELAPDEETAERARRFKMTKIPRHPVPHRAVQENLRGNKQIAARDFETARRTYEQLVKEYPDFEWAYCNLAHVYMQIGELQKAQNTLSKVLDLNPNYAKAWLLTARLKAAALELRLAQSYLDKALRLDPDEPNAAALKQMVDLLASI